MHPAHLRRDDEVISGFNGKKNEREGEIARYTRRRVRGLRAADMRSIRVTGVYSFQDRTLSYLVPCERPYYNCQGIFDTRVYIRVFIYGISMIHDP